MTTERRHDPSPRPEPAPAGGSARRRRGTLLASVLAVLVAGGGVTWWATAGGGGGPEVRPVSLAALGERPGSAAPEAGAGRSADGPSAPGIAPGEPDPGGSGVRYVAKGALPGDAGPASAYLPRPVSAERVARLAAALGLSGTPVREGGQWVVGEAADGTGPRLTVSDSGSGTWSFARFRGAGGDDCVRGKDTCGPATVPGSGAAGTDPAGTAGNATPPGQEAARKAADPVLAAAGLSGARIGASGTLGSARVVTADPVVGGLPTQGWTTSVRVGADGVVTAANGELAELAAGAARPALGAERALERLNAASAPAPVRPTRGPEGCVPDAPMDPGAAASGSAVPCDPDPRPIAPPAQPRTETVEKAERGLTAGTEAGARALVPAWLFTVSGPAGRTVAQPAWESAEPGPGRPGGETVPGFSYTDRDRALTVRFWGGVCSTYSLEVAESAAEVRVRVLDHGFEGNCVMVAKEAELTATLKAPLGARKVVDATSGETLRRG
ncbi:hypothetical protein ACN20G_19765 [Streptomyces sp. BI20]|uniref:hypothetical protein n=1 Tax=Streptomyces sp. BI20 TaxID=3403460 RepID=UPI003C776BCD